MFRKSKPLAAAGCILLCLGPLTGILADEQDETDGKRCIPINRISSTHVLDDYNILFYMRGKEIYRNTLPHRCIGLGRERRIMYKPTTSQLCNLDSITVLYNRGFGLSPGPSCGLGRFYPITEEEADALRNPVPPEPEPAELPTAEPEEIGEPQ